MKKIMTIKNLLMAVAVSVASLSGYQAYEHTNHTNIDSFLLENVEALANRESDTYVTCRCALWANDNCASNNNGPNTCAGGINAHCWDYDRNC